MLKNAPVKNENKEKIKTPSEEVMLLSEIRDLLKTDKTTKKKVTKK